MVSGFDIRFWTYNSIAFIVEADFKDIFQTCQGIKANDLIRSYNTLVNKLQY